MAEETQQTEAIFANYEPVDTGDAYQKVTAAKSGSQWKHDWFVLRSLVSKDFKLKYRRSVLGVLWSLLNPLLMMVVMAAVFSYMFRFQIEHFPVYLILGTIMFDFMSRGTTGAMSSIIESQALIKKVRIEKIIFPLEKVVFELVNFGLALVAAAVVMVYFQVVPSVHALWGLPFIIVMVTLFSTGLSLLISALSVFFRDVMHLWGVLMTAWTYATPLFYPYEMLAGWMQLIVQFNPMYHYINFFRSIMMWNTNPGILECLICAGMAIVTFLIGLLVFRKTESKFILYI
ncbi:MAG: ABC transporter permease [Coriobacteriaceae bacterium]|nr:ABC transporter permease [Coriobacteriaceae bacterium]